MSVVRSGVSFMWKRNRKRCRVPVMSSASVQGAVLTLCLICLLLSLLRRTNSDSALHTSAMNPNPQNPFGMNQQMGRGPPQRNGKSKMLRTTVSLALNPTSMLEV